MLMTIINKNLIASWSSLSSLISLLCQCHNKFILYQCSQINNLSSPVQDFVTIRSCFNFKSKWINSWLNLLQKRDVFSRQLLLLYLMVAINFTQVSHVCLFHLVYPAPLTIWEMHVRCGRITIITKSGRRCVLVLFGILEYIKHNRLNCNFWFEKQF